MYKSNLWYICLTVCIGALVIPSAIYLVYCIRRNNNVKRIAIAFLLIGVAFSFLYYYISINNDVYSFLPLGLIIFTFILSVGQLVFFSNKLVNRQ